MKIGRTRRKLAVQINAKLAALGLAWTIAPERIYSNGRRSDRPFTTSCDSFSWEAFGRIGDQETGLPFSIVCFETMGECLRRGFTLARDDSPHGKFTIDATANEVRS